MHLLAAFLCLFLVSFDVAGQPVEPRLAQPDNPLRVSLPEAAFNTANVFESVASRVKRFSASQNPNTDREEWLKNRDAFLKDIPTDYWQEFAYAHSLGQAQALKQEIDKETSDYELRKRAGERGIAITVIVTLIDFPLLWTLLVAVRARNSVKVVLAVLAGTFFIRLIAWPFALSRPIPEDMFVALWAQATFGLYLHRVLAFSKARPLFDSPIAFNLPHTLTGIRLFFWEWASRTIGLLNRWARRLDKCTLPLLVLLPFAFFSLHFINIFFVLYALSWGLYLFGFVVPLLVLEWIARFVFSAIKSGIHERIAEVAKGKLSELNQEYTEKQVPRKAKDWLRSGFEYRGVCDAHDHTKQSPEAFNGEK
ncbi:MAG: hypothetical protein EOM37_06615 [Proteobacteria bacterium]|nr:hypothetical protein [Alphaproteobacteria bacterium]NCC03700.1 hypothetical protein [Pseudomonadota bacterium]